MMNGFEYAGVDAILAGSFRAAIYCRLSKDDDLDGESASIANQRDMLENYCEKQGWEVVAVYQDDGYTGLNMERPDLKRMLKAIERRQINLVVTKDLSRLGRNYLQTGFLIEDFFPRNGVRYIAMNDGIDTMRDNNDIAPFKNILNEMYSKDISKKVHSSYLLKAQKGQFTGCLAPFGYRKDPEDKNHLLIDEETAPIVRRLFAWALEGHGPNYIRRRLEEEKIPCPTYWNRVRGFRNVSTKWEKKDPVNGRYMWDFSVIKDILMNPVYTGAIASQKKEYRFKIGTIGEKKPEDWIVVENQHEPLVDRKTFDIVQRKLKSRQRPRQTGEISLFAGLIKCGECGKSLTIRYTNDKHPKQIYSCKTYNAYGKQHCTQHRVEYDTLYSLVLNKIRECARAALMDGEAVAGKLTDTCEAEQKGQREALERSLTKDEERIDVLEKMVLRLYEDMVAGRISEANFNLLMEKTQKEQAELKAKVEEGRKKLADEIRLACDARQWVEAIQEYADITELDAATLNRLIKEIVVHERIDSDKTYCFHGRVNMLFSNQPEMVMSDHYISVFNGASHLTSCDFGEEPFIGVSVVVYLPQIINSLNIMLGTIAFDEDMDFQGLFTAGGCFIAPATKSVEHIFTELLLLPEQYRNYLMRIKVMELLLYLVGKMEYRTDFGISLFCKEEMNRNE